MSLSQLAALELELRRVHSDTHSLSQALHKDTAAQVLAFKVRSLLALLVQKVHILTQELAFKVRSLLALLVQKGHILTQELVLKSIKRRVMQLEHFTGGESAAEEKEECNGHASAATYALPHARSGSGSSLKHGVQALSKRYLTLLALLVQKVQILTQVRQKCRRADAILTYPDVF